MELGEWIEFEVIVRQERTATGSRPQTQALRRARRGMVVGRRQVCEVDAGTPPVLGQRQSVLLVAVSLNRCYRVFPADARPATPPTPRRRRAAAVSSGPVSAPPQAMPGASTPGRAPVTQSALDLLVADQINQHVAGAEIFTAYQITQALRAANPGVEIAHEQVRTVVHAQMEPLIASGLYEREAASFGGGRATRYLPA